MKNIANLAAALLLATASFAADVPAPAPPAEGTAAPKFTLPSQDSPSVSLDQFKGKWVVLYFYPKDFTSGCTLEAHNFQRDLAKYEAKNAVIVGVSEDNVDSHKGFCTKEGLSFKVLADTTEHSVATTYGSLMQYNGNTYAARNTFLIDPHGVIRKVYLKVKPPTHSDEILADLDTLQAKK
jgi:peroxiredoxin Q/BCP